MSKLVYLDSSDFSNLSLPDEQLSSEQRLILTTLRHHKETGTAKFFMSAVHFGEAVHASTDHKFAAVRRAKLMRELCGQNLLQFPTELPSREIRKFLAGAQSGSLTLEDITSKKGEWFGFGVNQNDLQSVRAELDSRREQLLRQMPRKKRREIKSKLNPKRKSARLAWEEFFPTNLSEFPLNLVTRDTTIGWMAGNLKDEDFLGEILNVMNDPYIMFSYFLDETKNRQRMYDILRENGRDITNNLQKAIESILPALQLAAHDSKSWNLNGLMKKVCAQVTFQNKFIAAFFDGDASQLAGIDLENLIKRCPSLCTFMELIKAYMLSISHAQVMRIRAGNSSVRPLNPSDYGDLMHSFYVPYFDVFRCDSRFGAHLKQQKFIRTKIADRATDLLRMLPVHSDLGISRA